MRTLLAAALLLTACGGSSPTVGDLCNDTAHVYCTRALECLPPGTTMTYAGCYAASMSDCCVSRGLCNAAPVGDVTAFEAACFPELRAQDCSMAPTALPAACLMSY